MPLDSRGNPRELVELHRQAEPLADREAAREMLFAAGFVDGMLDGLRAARAFRALPVRGPLVYPRHPLRIELQPRPEEDHLFFCLTRSPEAQLEAPSAGIGCLVTAGYGSGWHSALTRKTWLLREISCESGGRCRFEARRVQAWLDLDPQWTRPLLPALRFDRVEERIEEVPGAHGEPGLDPLCPAVQVWGPVVVLPYGGVREGRASLENVLRDPEAEPIRVAIIDVTGVRVDGAECLGLAQLDRELQVRGIDVIIAGRRGPKRGELETRDVDRGIALAFQLCSQASPLGNASG